MLKTARPQHQQGHYGPSMDARSKFGGLDPRLDLVLDQSMSIDVIALEIEVGNSMIKSNISLQTKQEIVLYPNPLI